MVHEFQILKGVSRLQTDYMTLVPNEFVHPEVRSGGRKILVVDDEEDVTDSLKAGLTRKGFVVDAYNDPRRALANLQRTDYDLVIFDIRMPGMNGLELYREFKKVDSHAIVCFFTAFDIYLEEFEKMFPDARVGAFFKKPMTISHLAAQLNELIPESSVVRPSYASTKISGTMALSLSQG
jgi:DNA-binding response OmpR family regulator